MKNKLAIPRSDYIVFELVKIDVDSYLDGEYKAIQEETIYLAVLPQQFNYRLTSRDSIRQTDESVFVNKFGMAPERCTISGHFGVRPRLVAGNYTDGWSRLKQFEDDIVRKSKESELPDTDDNRYIYALNYYDFIFQRFGSINIQSFSLTGNAKENTQLPRYSCDFLIIGKLIDTAGGDLFLSYLGLKNDAYKSVFGVVNSALAFGYLNTALQAVSVGVDAINTITSTIGSITSAISSSKNYIENLYNEAMSFVVSNASTSYEQIANLFSTEESVPPSRVSLSTQFYNNLEEALNKTNKIIAKIEELEEDEFSEVDYSSILNGFYQTERVLTKTLNMHKFNQLSKEAFIRNNDKGQPKKIEVEHTVKDFETPNSIAKKYNIELDDLLEKNGILSSGITKGVKIKVEVNPSEELNKIFNKVPTYGSHEGELFLGVDVSNELFVDEFGDIRTLTPEETLLQGLKNRVFTKTGDYPLEYDFGMDDLVGTEYPEDLIKGMATVKVSNQLLQDARVSSVESLEANVSGNGLVVSGKIITLNNKDLGI